MDFTKFMEWVFLAVLSGGVYILWLLKEQVAGLNTKIEVLFATQQAAGDSIKDHETRIRLIEKVI